MRQTRFIGQNKKRGKALVLHDSHGAVTEGRTMFPSRVVHPSQTTLLKSGMYNRKIGKRVMVGRWKGADIYTLTLQERDTCPRSCHHWKSCYGNNMPWPVRADRVPGLTVQLQVELATANAKAVKRGVLFVVRLHILGDFYSAHYVAQWEMWLRAFPALRVFGFTAHSYESVIGVTLLHVRAANSDRFAIRFSRLDPESDTMEAVPFVGEMLAKQKNLDGAFLCPAQRRDDKVCATCAACWESPRHVMFKEH